MTGAATWQPATVEPMVAGDWDAVRRIYAAGIASGDATFESAPPTWACFKSTKLDAHRYVSRVAGEVAGWVAVSPVSARPVYAGVVEHSVFVDPTYQGHGIGGQLLTALISSTSAAGIWTIQSHIFPENTASLRLHARHGFREVGVRRRLGRMTSGALAGSWRDVVLVERRDGEDST
jgi:L-amino acid N-acyltransferase YncA